MNIKTLRFVGTLEGISFLLLLGVAMPIKYIWDNPVFVKYIGMGHGVLFLLFLVVLLVVCHRMKWSLSIFNMGLIAAILPCILVCIVISYHYMKIVELVFYLKLLSLSERVSLQFSPNYSFQL